LTPSYFVFRREWQPTSDISTKTQTDKSPVPRNRGKGHFMHTQPRSFDSQITELPSSRCRASSAVGGNGEASAPVAADVPAVGGAALDLLLERSRTLAARVRAGEIEFLDAVDMAYSAAEFSGLVSRYGDDLVQATLALAFMDIPRRAA
jgi:hypothetical protein